MYTILLKFSIAYTVIFIANMSLSLKPTLKRKSIDMKEKIKIIKEYDAKMAKEGKVNKAQFAAKLGIPRSSLATIVGEKTH